MTIKCTTCPYFVNDGKYEYCAYYCLDVDRVIVLDVCNWVDKDDNNRNKHEKDTE